MKVAILGSGAIGSLLGAFLSKAGLVVSLVDPYAEHMNKIKSSGLTIHDKTNKSVEVVAFSQTYLDAKDAGTQDLVIVLVKGPYTKDALDGAKELFDSDTVVATLQNGLGNEMILRDYFGDEKVLYGMLNFTSQLLSPGEVAGDWSAPGYKVTLGSVIKEGKQVDLAKEVTKALDDIGFPSAYVEDINTHIWKKASNNVPCNALCGVLRLTVGEMYSEESGKTLMHGCLEEFIEVAKAMDIQLEFSQIIEGFERGALPVVSSHYPSLAQDVLHKKLTEIESLNGAISRYGRTHGIKTPINDVFADLIRVIQNHYDDQF